ncbi:MAG: MarR family transcriptional regulator [Ruminococcaceae bacterium]|nr:MarR family transcriptional regulator [Oscillospiraceae bacterium]
MRSEQREMINGFFVTAFNRILAWEDQSLRSIGKKDISVREMHIIEAVSMLEGKNMNTMANIAKVLSVSPGSLTTAVNALVAKEYLVRWRSETDRRVVLVSPTEKGVEVNERHKQFHNEMVEFVMQNVTEDELDVVLATLKRLTEFFMEKAAVKR